MSQPAGDPTTHVSLRLAADLTAQVDAVAAALDRSRSWVIQRALRLYLDGEGAEILDVAAGLEEARAGKTVEAGTVLAELQELVARGEPPSR